MAKHTFTTFNYNDENQKLAQALFQFKKSETYAVERMDIEGLNKRNNDIGEFVVVSEVITKFRKKKTDQWQTLDEFWTINNVFAKSCPHWERKSVSVTVGLAIRGDTGDNIIQQKLVTFHTYFDNKYKSQADGIANRIVSDDYDETCNHVCAEWNDNCITDGSVEMTPLTNGVGIMFALSKHLKQKRTNKNKEILDILAKVKV